jgi:integrase
MGHIQDRWYKEVVDPETSGKALRVPTALHGAGLRYKVRYIDPDGQERSKSYPDKKLKDARAFLAKVETDKLTGDYIDPAAGKTTLREYCDNWLKGQSQDESSQRTMRFKLEIQVYPSLGTRSLSTISAATIRDWLSWMNGNDISESHKSQVFDLLSAVLSAAVDEKKIRTNPCRAKGVKRPVPDKRKITPWTEGRLRKIQLALPPRQSIVIPLGSGLGLRQGEILGLSPDDIDRERMIVHIDRQLAYVGNRPLFKLPKGRKTRSVPISRGLLDVIDDHSDAYPPVAITLPWGKTTGDPTSVRVLIATPAGRVDTGSEFNYRHWRPAFTTAGLTYVEGEDGMHALRHFYASTLLARGVTIKELADYLGHTDPGFTLRTYTHLLPSSHEQARRAVDSLFKPRRPEKQVTGPGMAC